MKKTLFYKFGALIYPIRWLIIVLWFLILFACLPLLPHIIAPFKTTGFIAEHSESAKAEQELNKSLNYDHHNQLMIMYTSKNLKATSKQFNKRINDSLKDLKNFSLPYELLLPSANSKQISKDKHTAYVVVIVKSLEALHGERLKELKSLITIPPDMTVQIGGEPIFVEDVNQQTQIDLYKADMIATPVAIVTLLFVFGSVVAAFLPIFLGGGCALMILSSLYIIGHAFTLSIFTINIALLLGLCLSLDYALFIISRFRDELVKQKTIIDALAATQATAGKAIFFSGLAVFVSLSALYFFPINILFSVAVGGMMAVFVAVVTALVFLPAILAVLQQRINLLAVKIPHPFKHFRFWRWMAERVVKRPLVFFIPIFIFLLVLGYPFLSAEFGLSDYKIFPEQSKSRAFFDTYEQKFNGQELNPILLLVKTDAPPLLSKKNIYKIYDFTQEIKENPLVKQVNSIVTTSPELSRYQYYRLYTQKKIKDEDVKKMLDTTTSQDSTLLNIVSKYSLNSEQTNKLITNLETLTPPAGMRVYLTGVPVINEDIFDSIWENLPYALLWIMASTYLILLVLLRSLFLPFKAILMNLLSLCACYGALVFIFQEGHLAAWLNFQPQGMLDLSILVIIFCALFGFSMDYEVFLLSRIKEYYEATKSNHRSIIFGIEKTSRIITSAALIVIFLCGSFLVADVLMVKAFGLGIAVAIFVDAFLIRTLLVPSTMILLKKWNWYLPRWLNKILPKSTGE
ncbi:MMPL family transporter [Legionella sp. km772]|uniref:MMPL family transporter n=1 Tax=Legionella sp. km772 TaxID=2498111 RepID=UPI001F42CD29|nr:MMPL family transporter [Legionella sp. km772]